MGTIKDVFKEVQVGGLSLTEGAGKNGKDCILKIIIFSTPTMHRNKRSYLPSNPRVN